MSLQSWKTKIDKLKLRHHTASEQLKKEKAALKELKQEHEAAKKAQQIAQDIASTIQQKAHEKIASVVSRALEAVYDDPYQFKILFEQKRGRTEAKMVFIRDGMMLEDPKDEAGGGVVDVASFALRLACLVLSRPPLRQVLVLDEPFKFVQGRENRIRVRQLLEELSKELGVQIIMVTQTRDRDLVCGKVIDLQDARETT